MPWTLQYNGLTQTLPEWGLNDIKMTLKAWESDELSVRAAGRAVDAPMLFAPWSNIALFDPNGVCRFVGIMEKPPVRGSGSAEDQFYTLSGPWWDFKNLAFQETWMIQGANDVLTPTLRATVIVGSNATQTGLNLGQMVQLVLNYVLAAITADNSPCIPFQLGTIDAFDQVIPFTEVADLYCSQLLINLMAWCPDAVMWFDYTTLDAHGKPLPTLNISRRCKLKSVSFPAFGGPAAGSPVSGMSITPRFDLVVPDVILKFIGTTTVDGTAITAISPDIYPPNSPDPAFRNMVADVRLTPGNLTYQKQPLSVTDRPTDYSAVAKTGTLKAITWSWLTGEKRMPRLNKYTIPANWPVGYAPYPQGNPTMNDVDVIVPEEEFIIRRVATTLPSNFNQGTGKDPTVLVLPSGNVPAGGGAGTANATDPDTGIAGNALDFLGEEVLSGSVQKWMTTDQNVYAAHLQVAIDIEYIGADYYIKEQFGGQAVPLLGIGPPSPVLKHVDFAVNCTNGQTETYTELASETLPEPAPSGLAQLMYEGLSKLHYDGTINLTEQECSGTVSPGTTLNLTGSANPNWATMQAQVFEVTQEIDTGKTAIRIGPPKHLSAGELIDIIRAIRGREPSWSRSQQQTGDATSDSSVEGTGLTPHAGATVIGVGNRGALGPWTPMVIKENDQWFVFVPQISLIVNSPAAGDTVPIANMGEKVQFNPNNDILYVEIPISNYVPVRTGVMLKSYYSGGAFNPALDAWDASGNAWLAYDGDKNQTFYRVKLMSFAPDSYGNPIPTQCCFKNIILKNSDVNGYACLADLDASASTGATS